MDQLYKEIVSFQRKVNDYIDDPTHHVAQSLKQEVQRLEDEAQVRKNPQSIENRVKSVIRLLEQAGENQTISHGHVLELVRYAEDFIQDLRKIR